MAKYCRKCGCKKEECTCKKSNINYPMITTIVITILIVVGLVYFIASLIIAKPGKQSMSLPPNIEKEEVSNSTIKEEHEQKQNQQSQTKEEVDTYIVTCSGNDGRTDNQNIFYFEDGSIYKYVVKIEIPKEYDVKDFYTDEEIMNSGRYKMSLSGRTITKELDTSMPYWNNFIYKDEPYRRVYKIFTEDGYNCEG